MTIYRAAVPAPPRRPAACLLPAQPRPARGVCVCVLLRPNKEHLLYTCHRSSPAASDEGASQKGDARTSPAAAAPRLPCRVRRVAEPVQRRRRWSCQARRRVRGRHGGRCKKASRHRSRPRAVTAGVGSPLPPGDETLTRQSLTARGVVSPGLPRAHPRPNCLAGSSQLTVELRRSDAHLGGAALVPVALRHRLGDVARRPPVSNGMTGTLPGAPNISTHAKCAALALCPEALAKVMCLLLRRRRSHWQGLRAARLRRLGHPHRQRRLLGCRVLPATRLRPRCPPARLRARLDRCHE